MDMNLSCGCSIGWSRTMCWFLWSFGKHLQ